MSDGGTDIKLHKGMGLVTSVFSKETLQNVKGTLGIGHTRYSTLGSSDIGHAQPLVVDTVHGRIAVAHNGELVNAKSLRTSVMQSGVGLSTKTDSELIAQLLTITPSHGERDGRPDWPARIRNFMDRSETAYSIVVIAGKSLFAVRDPVGNRPLCLGKLIKSDSSTSPSPKRMCLNGGGGAGNSASSSPGWVVSSESCSFWSAGAKLVRELLPGEIVEIRASGFESHGIVKPKANTISPALCVFEYVYFARPDSVLEGQMVYSVRKQCGKQLALESPVDADVISTVPESATPAAIGYAEQSGIRYAEVLMKSRYAGRTFIRPDERSRRLGVMHKFGPLTENFKGKRVVLVDDSIVRGTTIGPIIRMLKVNGAKEVRERLVDTKKYMLTVFLPFTSGSYSNRLSSVEIRLLHGNQYSHP